MVHSPDDQVETIQSYTIDALLLHEVQKLHRQVEDGAALSADLAAQQREETAELRARPEALASPRMVEPPRPRYTERRAPGL